MIQRCTRCERLSCRCASCPVCGRSAAYRGLERVYCADPLCANFPWRVSEANEVRQRIETLASSDTDLRAAWEQHVDLKAKLDAFDARPHLTPEEQVERKRLQKLKLAAKDRVSRILASHG